MYRSVLAILLAYVKLRPQMWMEIVMLACLARPALRGALALLLALPVASTLSAGAALAQPRSPPGWLRTGRHNGRIHRDGARLAQAGHIELDFVTAGGSGASNSLPARSISAIAATPFRPRVAAGRSR